MCVCVCVCVCVRACVHPHAYMHTCVILHSCDVHRQSCQRTMMKLRIADRMLSEVMLPMADVDWNDVAEAIGVIQYIPPTTSR